MLRRSLKVKSLQVITLALLLVMVSSGITVLLATPMPATPRIQTTDKPLMDGPVGETITNFARKYAESFTKPALEKIGPNLKQFYKSGIISDDVAVRNGQISVVVITGPVPIEGIFNHMIVSSTFDAGFGKFVMGTVNSPEQVHKIARIPGVIHIEADCNLDVGESYGNVIEAYQKNPVDINSLYPDPAEINQFKGVEVLGAVRVWDEIGYNGTGVRISIHDTGTDFGNPDLGYDALARTNAGYPDVIDATGAGFGLTDATVTKNAAGNLTVSAVETAHDLEVWHTGGGARLDYYTFYADIPPALQDFKAPSVDSKSGNYKFGIVSHFFGLYGLYPFVLVDSTTSGVYDTLFVDLETSLYLTGELTEYLAGGTITYPRYPQVMNNLFDFSDDEAITWGGGKEIIAKDFDSDGFNDFGLGTLGFAMDLNGAFSSKLTVFGGINSTGSGFAFLEDDYGHGTWTASIAGGRGRFPYTSARFCCLFRCRGGSTSPP
ncbi:MAG: hypothetical protein ACFFBD_16975, partial [Candidatus Hodarchaeota archaeon]